MVSKQGGVTRLTTQSISFFGLLVDLWRHLAYRRKSQFLMLAILLPLGGVAEVISLGAVLPLLTVLMRPENVFKYEYIKNIAEIFSITNAEQLVTLLFFIFGALVIVSAAFRIALLWIMTSVAFGCGADLCAKVYKVTLYQPYSKHITQHSSGVITGIAGKVAGCAVILQQILLLSNAAVMASMIVIAMFLISPLIALMSAIGFGAVYICISKFSRSRLQKNSEEIAIESENLIRSLQEGLGAIRDILIDGTQPIFISAYQKTDVALRKAQCNNNVIAASPRFVVEAFGIILIAIVSFYYSFRASGLIEVLPVLGMLVLAAQRLLPALQQIYAAWACVVGMQASLIDAISLLNQKMPICQDGRKVEELVFAEKIEAKSLSFKYSPEGAIVLNDISFIIPIGSRVGIVGATGSGKSTLLDILMGLLQPTTGSLLVDEQAVNGDKIKQWQKIIAHVPQSIYLTNASLAENIAFGVPLEKIDMKRVQNVAKQAQISDFIDGLEYGYATSAGERGARLSGGQRQRIGIARALYKNAKVLMLDEATSALDEVTEKYVMDTIEGLGRGITILIIAHRLSTLEKCEYLYKVENGHLSVIRNGSELGVL